MEASEFFFPSQSNRLAVSETIESKMTWDAIFCGPALHSTTDRAALVVSATAEVYNTAAAVLAPVELFAVNDPVEAAVGTLRQRATIRRQGDRVTATFPSETRINVSQGGVEDILFRTTVTCRARATQNEINLTEIQGLVVNPSPGLGEFVPWPNISAIRVTEGQARVTGPLGLTINIELPAGAFANIRSQLREANIID